jgi:hypothetical protein
MLNTNYNNNNRHSIVSRRRPKSLACPAWPCPAWPCPALLFTWKVRSSRIPNIAGPDYDSSGSLGRRHDSGTRSVDCAVPVARCGSARESAPGNDCWLPQPSTALHLIDAVICPVQWSHPDLRLIFLEGFHAGNRRASAPSRSCLTPHLVSVLVCLRVLISFVLPPTLPGPTVAVRKVPAIAFAVRLPGTRNNTRLLLPTGSCFGPMCDTFDVPA